LIAETMLRVGGIELDKEKFSVRKDGEAIALQPKEFAILQLLMEHPDRYFTAEAILSRLWRVYASLLDHSGRAHGKMLRKKLGEKEGEKLIVNTRGLGYKMSTQA